MSTAITSDAMRRRATNRTATPVTNMASVESMNGAPRIAPMPDVGRRRAAGEDDGDDRDHRLGQGRPDRRQDGADRPFGQVEVVAEPLDAVGEQLRPDEDDDEGDGQDDEVHGSGSRVGRAAGQRHAGDAGDDGGEDAGGSGDEQPLPRPGEPDGGGDDPGDRRHDDGQQAQPQEGGRIERAEARRRGSPGPAPDRPRGARCRPPIMSTTPTVRRATESR